MKEDLIKKGNYLFFLRDWPSNWERSSMVIDGERYNCVEQFMMAEKARLFDDQSSLKLIMSAAHPSDQKKFGRAVTNYDDKKWSEVRYDVVLRGTVEKYRQNSELLQKLLDSDASCEFVEASPYDNVWGIGMKSEDSGIENKDNWLGQNLLGKAVTEAREILKKEINSSK